MPGWSPAGAAKGVSRCLPASARHKASQKPAALPRKLPPSLNPPPVWLPDRDFQARQAPSPFKHDSLRFHPDPGDLGHPGLVRAQKRR